MSADQELLERELRIEQMQTNIEKMRADLQDGRDKMRADIKHANRTFIIQLFGVVVTALTAGAALGHYFIK